MEAELLIHNIGYILSGTIIFALGAFVFLRAPNKLSNALFFLFLFFASLFTFSHLLGVNANSPELARFFFLFNACNIFIVVFAAHWTLVLLGKNKSRRVPITLIYIVGLGMFAFFMMNPETFMGVPEPLFYFPNYYNEGPLYWTMTTYFMIVLVYFLFELTHSYLIANPQERKKLKYLIAGQVIVFAAGLLAALPLYGIYVDPIFSAFIWVGAIPYLYTMIGLDLMNLNIITKRASIYALWVVFLSVLIIIINSITVSIRAAGVSVYIIPVISSIIIVLIGRFIWGNLKDAEVLKYEFITIVTHKFRTPLTSIKWSAEMLKETTDPEEMRKHISYIEKANTQLVELTNILIETSSTESTSLEMRRVPVPIKDIVSGVISSSMSAAQEKGITIHSKIPDNLSMAVGDTDRLRFVMQVFIDNAIMYSHAGKNIYVTLEENSGMISCTVKDEGIGISREDLPRVFEKFFRSAKATHSDTEGVGLGLFMAKTIIDKIGGTIWAHSDGEDKGTTVGFKLRVAK